MPGVGWCHLGIIWYMKPQRWKMVWGGHHGRTEGGWARHFPRPADDWFDLTISWSCMKFEEALNIYTSWNWPRLHRGGRRVEGGSRGRHSSAANTRVQGEMFLVIQFLSDQYLCIWVTTTTWLHDEKGVETTVKLEVKTTWEGNRMGGLRPSCQALGKLKHSKTAGTRKLC